MYIQLVKLNVWLVLLNIRYAQLDVLFVNMDVLFVKLDVLFVNMDVLLVKLDVRNPIRSLLDAFSRPFRVRLLVDFSRNSIEMHGQHWLRTSATDGA